MDVWQEIETELDRVFGRIELEIDGHRVVYENVFCNRRVVIMTWVDKAFLGKWSSADENGAPRYPEGRFLRPRYRSLYTKQEIAKLRRALGKKKADQLAARKSVAFDPHWNTPQTLVRHLKKTFPGQVHIVAKTETAKNP